MFARNVSIHLKPNSSVAFTKLIENETIPTLRKQEGFQGELTLLAPGGTEAVGISFWDKKENAEAYARNGYPEVMKSVNMFAEGTPKVQTYEVANSTFHTHEHIAALAYTRWQEKGCPEGTHDELWLTAERELIANREVAVQAARS
jgi:hypothetical protein